MKRYRVPMAPGIYRYKRRKSDARALCAALDIRFYEENVLGGCWVKRKP